MNYKNYAMNMNVCKRERERERERERQERDRVLKSVGFPVQTQSIADGDAAVFIPNSQPQLSSVSTSHTVDEKDEYLQQ